MTLPKHIVADELSILLLAAGSSSRLGQSKQLLAWQNKTLLEHAISVAQGTGIKNITVVLGANENVHRRQIENYPVTIIHNTQWNLGMGNSLKFGIQHIQKSSVEGALIMVCDQPQLTSEHLHKMISLFDESKRSIVASAYSQTLGVPVLFPRDFFEVLLTIGDQEGARKIIQQNKDSVIAVDFPEGEMDIDTREDLLHLKAIKKA